MILQLLITMLIALLNLLFFFMPVVSTLPVLFGVDIDTALVQGVGGFYRFTTTFWMFGDLLLGVLFLMGYYLTKTILRIFLGSRVPGADA